MHAKEIHFSPYLPSKANRDSQTLGLGVSKNLVKFHPMMPKVWYNNPATAMVIHAKKMINLALEMFEHASRIPVFSFFPYVVYTSSVFQ